MPIGEGTKVVWNLDVAVRDEKIDELGGACQRLDVTALLHVRQLGAELREGGPVRETRLGFPLLSVGLGPIRVETVAAEPLGPLRLQPVFGDEADARHTDRFTSTAAFTEYR